MEKENLKPWERELVEKAEAAEEQALRESTGAYQPEEIAKRNIEAATENRALQLRKQALKRKYEKQIEIVDNPEVLVNLEQELHEEGFHRFPPAIDLDTKVDIEEKLADALADPADYRIVLFGQYALMYKRGQKLEGV